MEAVTEYEIGSLLEQVGARPRGKRHDCPKCGGLRTVTHSDEVFYCHKCEWKGNAITLAKELGLYRWIPPAEYRALCQKHERAEDAARRLSAAVHARRMKLLAELQPLNQLEVMAHEAGPNHRATWGALALVYAERPHIEAELDFLESASAAELMEFLTSEAA